MTLLGRLLAAEGKEAEAAHLYGEALGITLETGAAPLALDIMVGVARLLLSQAVNKPGEAGQLLAMVRQRVIASMSA